VPADLAEYYRNRAPVYEAIYFRPDAQRLYELEELARALREWLKGRDVLEIATGTGWWTVHAASVAKSMTATDLNEETLAIAQMKPLDNVRFLVADAYNLEEVPGKFDGFLACFWLSHVSRRDLKRFFDGVHKRLMPGSRVFLADNAFVADFGGEFLQPHGDPDTYRIREDEQGNEHQILKNYYTENEFRQLLPEAKGLIVHIGPCYWWVMYETP
jgi:ubiquinone/menaquinone biosynthesis C-methylase UbiE